MAFVVAIEFGPDVGAAKIDETVIEIAHGDGIFPEFIRGLCCRQGGPLMKDGSRTRSEGRCPVPDASTCNAVASVGHRRKRLNRDGSGGTRRS
jgi:hypothetical protein